MLDLNSTNFAALLSDDVNISDYLSYGNSSVDSASTDWTTTCSPELPDCVIDHTKVCIGHADYCNLTESEYRELLAEYIYPSVSEWILICSHIFVFLLGLVSLVCGIENLLELTVLRTMT